MDIKKLLAIFALTLLCACENSFVVEDNTGDDLFARMVRSWYSKEPAMRNKASISFNLAISKSEVAMLKPGQEFEELAKVVISKEHTVRSPFNDPLEAFIERKNIRLSKRRLIPASPKNIYGLEHYYSKSYKTDTSTYFTYIPENANQSGIKAVISVYCSDPVKNRRKDTHRECRMRIYPIPKQGNIYNSSIL